MIFDDIYSEHRTMVFNLALQYVQNIEDAEEMVNQSEDTISILSKFIDGLSVDVDSDKLKKLMRELYVESLNVEIIE